MSVIIDLKEVYENFQQFRAVKNKANQSQFPQSTCDWNSLMLYTAYLVKVSLTDER